MGKQKKMITAVLIAALVIVCAAACGRRPAGEETTGQGQETGQEAVSAQESERETDSVPLAETALGAESEGETSAAPETEEAPADIPVDFAALQEQNPEVYAWLSVPGTKIDYPVAQRFGDNEFYLHHNINGEYEFAGMIYTEDWNVKDFTDPNTIIYGHNMKNDTMFTTLHYFEDREFFDSHRDVIIYTPEKTLRYEIFAAYPYDNRHLMVSFDFWNREVFADYLSQVREIRDMKAYFNEDVEVTADDRIVTLSTCISGQADRRYLVQAVLREE